MGINGKENVVTDWIPQGHEQNECEKLQALRLVYQIICSVLSQLRQTEVENYTTDEVI